MTWPRRAVFLLVLVVTDPGCSAPRTGDGKAGLTTPAFRSLLDRLARSWETQDPEAAVALFAPDAIYMQPPDVQLFTGHSQLRSYFGAVEPGTFMRWHHVWFDARTQVGAGELSFGVTGRVQATHGVAVIQIRDGLIASWHEYLQPGPPARDRFLSTGGKVWKWHIGNYP